ncbi:pLS20_p028 family conjugation system transmembrane protein, partial [Bacillus cytotoxicus]
MAATKLKEWVLHSKRAVVIGVFTVFILICSFVFTPVIFADGWWDEIVWKVTDIDKGQAIAFLKNDWIEYANILGSIVQSIEGSIIQGLLILVSSLEGLIPETFSFFDLLKDAGLNEFATSIMKGLFYALLLLVIVWLAIKTIIQYKPPRFKSVGVNIIVMIGLLGGLNELMADMQKMAIDFYKDTTNDSQAKEGLAWNLVKHNTADLAYLSVKGFAPIKNKDSKAQAISNGDSGKNGLSKEMYLKADLGDLITPDVVGKLKDQDGVAEETKFLAYKVTNNGAEEALEEIDDSFFDPFKDTFPSGYIRYPMNFGTIFWGLIALGIAYLFTIFVFVMTIFEIAMKKIIAPLVFVTDMETGEKTKMVMQDILRSFMLFGFTGLSLRFYTIAVNFLSGKDINAFLYIVAMFCLTMSLIKGSESILRYFGVDVGLKEGKNHLMGMLGGLALAKGAVNSVGKGIGKAYSGAKNMFSNNRQDSPKRSEGNEGSSGEGTKHQNARKNPPNMRKGGKMGALVQASSMGAKMMAATTEGPIREAMSNVNDIADKALETDKTTANGFGKNKGAVGNEKEDTAIKNQLSNTQGELQDQGESGQTTMKARSDKQKVERELDVANRMKNSGKNEVPNDQAKGDRQQVERELEVANRINNPGRNEVPNEQAKGNRQQVERELEVTNRMNNPGRNEAPNEQAKGNRQQVERELEVTNRMNNPGRNEVPNEQAKGNRQQVERELEVTNRMNNPGRNEVPNEQAKGNNQQVERQINVADRLNSVGGSATLQNSIKPESGTVQREINVQDNVRNNGPVSSGNVNVSGTTVQREVNVQDNVKSNGPVSSGNVNISGTTVQREVNVQDNVKSNGSVSSGNVNISGTTVQREVNVQDNVKSNGSVSSGNVNISGTTVQREVNVQDNVKTNGSVSSGNV